MIQLNQNTWPDKKEVTIAEDGLMIATKTLREDLEYTIKFDELGFEIIRKRIKTANLPFIGFIFFDLVYIGLLANAVVEKEPISHQIMWSIALVFFSAITLLSYLSRNKDVVLLTGGKTMLELHANKPDHESVNVFINEVHTAMRQYFKKKYSAFDPGTPYEMKLNHLRWLKEIKAISEHEYKQMLREALDDEGIDFGHFISEN